MNIATLRQEFGARYYRWAQVEAARELAESFPTFASFAGGITWKMYQFIGTLSQHDQRTYVHALLKHYHAAAAKLLKDPISTEEAILLDRGWSFNLSRFGRELEVPARRRAGETVTFASKRRLRTAMDAKFRQEFGEQCIEHPAQMDRELRFWMKYNSWIVLTSFWFGRQRSLLSYQHLIASEATISHPDYPEITAPAQTITLMCWIGLCPIQWEYIYDEEVQSVCGAVITQCRQVFAEMPRLLDGL